MRWTSVLVALIGLAASVVAADRTGDDPMELIPADALLCWQGRPLPDAQLGPAEQRSTVETFLRTAMQILSANLKPADRLGVRLLSAITVVGRYPFALALLDAQAVPISSQPDANVKVDQLKLVLAIDVDGNSEPFRQIINGILQEQVDAGSATLVAHEVEGFKFQELTDRRLPEWSQVAWGQVDDYFVLTLGRDVWARVASVAAGKEPSIATEEWTVFTRARSPQRPLMEFVIAARALRERLDPFVHGRATAFFRAWTAEDVDRAHWLIGYEGRALFCISWMRKGETILRRTFADPANHDPKLLGTFPEDTRYAIFNLEVDRFLRRIFAGYYATRPPEAREKAIALWEKIQSEKGFNADRDLLAHLGNTIVFHNHPPHPAKLPIMFTSLIEIRDEPAVVERTLETLCQAWKQGIEDAADETGERSPTTLERDPDGIWYLQFGFGFIKGMAWTCTDRFIVTSWSPDALREYLRYAGDRVGKRQ